MKYTIKSKLFPGYAFETKCVPAQELMDALEIKGTPTAWMKSRRQLQDVDFIEANKVIYVHTLAAYYLLRSTRGATDIIANTFAVVTGADTPNAGIQVLSDEHGAVNTVLANFHAGIANATDTMLRAVDKIQDISAAELGYVPLVMNTPSEEDIAEQSNPIVGHEEETAEQDNPMLSMTTYDEPEVGNEAPAEQVTLRPPTGEDRNEVVAPHQMGDM